MVYKLNQQGHPHYDIYQKDGNNTKVQMPVTEYIIKGIIMIKRVLDFLIKSGPFIEEYGPLVRDITKMYKVMRVLQKETENNPEADRQEFPLLDQKKQFSGRSAPAPMLYI